jgi:hypothetical protein
VLLANGWHEITSIDGKSTFGVDVYEFIEGAPSTVPAGEKKERKLNTKYSGR